MQKRPVNWTIDQELFKFVIDVQDKTGLPSQSKTAELLFDIVRDYLSDQQIIIESQSRGVRDNRRNKK